MPFTWSSVSEEMASKYYKTMRKYLGLVINKNFSIIFTQTNKKNK